MPFDIKSSSVSTWTHERFREAEVKEYRQCFDDQGALTGLKIDPWHAATVWYGVEMLPENHPVPVPFTRSMRRDTDFFPIPDECLSRVEIKQEEEKALTNNEEPEDLDELGRPRLGKGPDASTTRLTLPGQDDAPARVDDAADAPPVEVPLQGSSPEGRGGCAVA